MRFEMLWENVFRIGLLVNPEKNWKNNTKIAIRRKCCEGLNHSLFNRISNSGTFWWLWFPYTFSRSRKFQESLNKFLCIMEYFCAVGLV